MSAPEDKSELERQKLKLEIRALQKPFRNNPAHWISSITAILAIMAVFLQYRVSRNEFILAEAKSVQAQNETEKAKQKTDELNQKVTDLEQDIAAKSKRRDELEAILRNADSLLSKAQPAVDPTLRSEIAKLRETTQPSSPFWSSLPNIVNQPELKEAANAGRLLRDANQQLMNAHRTIQEKELNGFQNVQSGLNLDFKNKRIENALAFVRPGYTAPKSSTNYVIKIVGNELQFSFSQNGADTMFYRTPADQPVYDKNFEEAVKRSVEAQLKTELDRSD
jgi:cell division protein FtsB